MKSLPQKFGKRVLKAAKHAKLTESKLATKIGASQQTISHLINKGKSSQFTVQIATACEVDAGWLATGEGEMLKGQRNTSVSTKNPDWESNNTVSHIRIYNNGVYPPYNEGNQTKAINDSDLKKWQLNPETLWILQITSDAMAPRLYEGDEVLIDTSNRFGLGDDNGKIFAILYGNHIRARRLEIRYDSALIINTDNPALEFKQEIIEETERKKIPILGKVVRVISSKV